ncbi:MAG: class I SAM-dependent methyltransferase [Candidatus Latescibacterota bacterium]|jgi:SAM-dependent methyltransferase|nr:class I SAM-dependent methyltransferase [Candidatus Latescibacterota bacterium]
MEESTIASFWDEHPCGQDLITSAPETYLEFFDEYDEYRYRTEGHILKCLDDIEFRGKRVLEVGLGQGADSEQIVRRGARWSGIDVTRASVQRVQARFALRSLKAESLQVGSAVDLPFEDESFDLVYSHGVLHHIPNIFMAQAEISRVLKPEGRLVAMLYAKYSLNYILSIALVRRLALAICYTVGIEPKGKSGEHVRLAREAGLLNYLKMSSFVHRNTDGPLNPYSKVYSLSSVKEDFRGFDLENYHKEFMHAPPLPVGKLPFAPLLGWHLWVNLRKKQ